MRGCSELSAIGKCKAKPHWFTVDPHYSVEERGQGLTNIAKDQKIENSLYMEKCQYLLKIDR